MTDEQQKFEAWAVSEGLISESHGVRFVNSMCDVAKKAWQARALLAAGASEWQKEPVAQIVRGRTVAGLDVWDIKIFDKTLQNLTPLYAHPSAEIAALRERIAGMEKDAERYRWLASRFTGYDFDWMPSEPDADDGKSVAVFDVGREFRGGRDVTAAIDAAIAKETK